VRRCAPFFHVVRGVQRGPPHAVAGGDVRALVDQQPVEIERHADGGGACDVQRGLPLAVPTLHVGTGGDHLARLVDVHRPGRGVQGRLP